VASTRSVASDRLPGVRAAFQRDDARIGGLTEKPMKAKWYKLGAMLLGAGTLLQFGGCLNIEDFWQGFWNTGWPTNNTWLNIAIDVLNEELFG
jgi:hypothetical protein